MRQRCPSREPFRVLCGFFLASSLFSLAREDHGSLGIPAIAAPAGPRPQAHPTQGLQRLLQDQEAPGGTATTRSPRHLHRLPQDHPRPARRVHDSGPAAHGPEFLRRPFAHRRALPRLPHRRVGAGTDGVDQLGIERWPTLDRPASFPGILSPLPWALPPISPKMFSPSFDPNVFSILQELSPVFGSSSSSGGKAFLTSPSNSFLSTPIVPSREDEENITKEWRKVQSP
ncbi:unnamed protein product [Musa hybrid cultivar]